MTKEVAVLWREILLLKRRLVAAGITALTGDVTAGSGSGSQAATIANDAVTNAKLDNMAAGTIKGRALGAGTGDPTDLTSTQATAILDNLVGDSGAGGTKGLAPAPAAGDAASGKFLKADGLWVTPSGTGAPTDAEYLVGTANATLSAERVVTDTSSITWDLATAAQAKAKRAALTGDVTASADSNATSIANDAVTNAQAANMAQATVKGRAAGAGTGDPTDLTAAQVKTIVALEATVGITIDGGGVAITTGVKGFVQVPFGMTVTAWRLVADVSGSIVVDVWKDTYGNFPPTVADTIAASAKPTLASAQKNEDTTLTGWTTAIAAGDYLGWNVDSAATVTRVTLQLIGTRT